MPLHIPLLLLHRAAPDLKQSHRHPRPHLRQLDLLVARFHKDVVSDLNAILPIHKSHDATPQLLARRRRRHRLSGRKQVFEDLHDALPERGAEALEDEVRVRLTDGPTRGGGEVVAQLDVVQGEGGGGPVREVRDRQRGGDAAVLVQDAQVAQPGRVRARDQVRQDQVAPVQPDGGRQQQADLLGEGGEPGGGRARGRDQDAGVRDAAEVRVFVVEVERRRVRGRGLRFVVFEILPEGGVVGDGGGERPARGEGGFESGPLGGDFGVAEGEGSAVEVVAPLAGLPADHGGGGM